MTPRPKPSGPDISSPAKCREEAVRQGRLAQEAKTAGDRRKVDQHLDRERELRILALELEADWIRA